MKAKPGLTVITAILLFVFFISPPAVSWASAPGKVDRDSILNAYARFPLYFIENNGQLDPKVRFYVKASGQTLYFAEEGIVFDLIRSEKTPLKDTAVTEKGRQIKGTKQERLVFNLSFENYRKGLLIQGLDIQNAGINYFAGNDKSKWKTGIPTYKGIIYKEVYKSIDLKIFGNGRGIEYEFIVNSGGNPDDIVLAYNGIEELATNEEGELLIVTQFGELKETRPYIYQEIDGKRAVDGSFDIRKPSSGKFRVGTFSYGFRVASYNPSYPLIIDPTIVYSTYLGGSGDNWGNGIAIDGSGNAYVSGRMYQSDFPVENPFQGTFAGGATDAFITKISPFGNTLVYSTYLGGDGEDWGDGIAVDASGNAYVTGRTNSGNFPTQNPYQGTLAGSSDAFITKISPSGSSLIYSTYLGGSGSDFGNGIAVDASGKACVTGRTSSNDFPLQSPYQGTFGGGIRDAFVTQLDSSGNALAYSTYLGGSDEDYGNGIAVDASGCAYITGGTSSGDFPVQDPYQATFGGSGDVFITKVSPSGGALIYSTYLGGSSLENGDEIAVDTSGNAFVTGRTSSIDFPVQNPYQAGYGGGLYDAFAAKISSSGGALSYSTYLGGSSSDCGYGIAVDASGYAYITGSTSSGNFPVQDPYQATFGGDVDVFITKISSSGSALAYSTYLGGTSYDSAMEIATDGEGNAYITGYTYSSDFPVVHPYQGTNAGNNDAFILKLNDATLSSIPTLNELGVITLSLILMGIGYITIRRRKNSSFLYRHLLDVQEIIRRPVIWKIHHNP